MSEFVPNPKAFQVTIRIDKIPQSERGKINLMFAEIADMNPQWADRFVAILIEKVANTSWANSPKLRLTPHQYGLLRGCIATNHMGMGDYITVGNTQILLDCPPAVFDLTQTDV